MSVTVIPTQDGNFIASCRLSGKSVSGRNYQHALSNLLSSAPQSSSQTADEKGRAGFVFSTGAAPSSGQDSGDEE